MGAPGSKNEEEKKEQEEEEKKDEKTNRSRCNRKRRSISKYAHASRSHVLMPSRNNVARKKTSSNRGGHQTHLIGRTRRKRKGRRREEDEGHNNCGEGVERYSAAVQCRHHGVLLLPSPPLPSDHVVPINSLGRQHRY